MPMPVDRYRHFYGRRDPLADEVARGIARGKWGWPEVERALADVPDAKLPTPLIALADALSTEPLWLDPARLDLGSRAIGRLGVLGSVVLAVYSLPLGYLSAAAVKPIARTGRLVERAPRRLAETNRFLVEVTRPGGLAVGADGWRMCGRVRIVHALVRQRFDVDDSWDTDAWGQPINQAHMAGTNLLFSLQFIEGMRRLGARLSASEVDAILHLWRWVGQLLGIEDEVLVGSEQDGWRLWALIREAEPGPDADSWMLTKALIEQAVPTVLGHLFPRSPKPETLAPLLFRLSASLIGRDTAEALHYPAMRGPLVGAPLLRTLVGTLETVRGNSPRTHALLEGIGGRLTSALADRALRPGGPVRFDDVA
ncbi:MAG: DUF2236 domain-containing protein [Myxococcales bacterium]|nr:DUF2236 domain-containing protein [Myxococcales bacterium]